jgi:hypothetical protein
VIGYLENSALPGWTAFASAFWQLIADLENSAFSEWARGESLWGWPFALTIHAFGTAIVIGFVFIIGLRVLGFFRSIPLTSLTRLFPVVWIGAVFQFLSGFTLWMTKPSKYLSDWAFIIKFSLVVSGLVVTGFYFRMLRRKSAEWEAKGAVSGRGYVFVAVTMAWWAAVLVAGRLTAYLGNLYAQ